MSLASAEEVRSVHCTSAQPTVEVPLATDGGRISPADLVALSFEVRGEKGGENVGFELGLASTPPSRAFLGTVLEFLPAGISTDWQRVVLGITPQAAAALPPATSLVVRLLEGEEAVVSVRKLQVIPRATGSETFDRIAIGLDDAGRVDLLNTPVLVLDWFKGSGARVRALVDKPEPSPPGEEGIPASQAPEFKHGFYLIANFDHGRVLTQQGPLGTFQRAPSRVRMDLDDQVHRGKSGMSLRLDYERAAQGFCGFWLPLVERKRAPGERLYFDATSFSYLSFWVKGLRGDEDATVQIADYRWERREDSVPLATVSEVLGRRVGDEWQEVIIPLDQSKHPEVDFSRLASLSFNFRRGAGVLFVDDVAFKTSGSAQVGESAAGATPSPRKALRRATWIWSPDEILDDEKERQELFDFSRRRGLNVLFMQIHCNQGQVDGQAVCRLDQEEKWREFLREAHQRGIEVQALDGYSYYVLPPWWPKVLAQVRAIVDYNARVAPEERFAGIHHDNEAYLIPAPTPARAEELLVSFLELTAACQQLVRESASGLVYGVDIPFWYDDVEVTWQGAKKPVSKHVLDTVDQVGVMAYRTSAYGADGVIVLASDEIDYADQQGKQVFVALETSALRTHVTFVLSPESSPGDAPRANPGARLWVDKREGVAVFYWKDSEAQATGGKSTEQLDLPEATTERPLFARLHKTEVSPAKLTFAEFSARDLEAVAGRVEEEFRQDSSFAGVAIHDYDSYRKLTQR